VTTNSTTQQSTHDPGARALKKVAGPFLLWGIAVGAVISGDYYGWNAGLGLTGYWGFLVAIFIMGLAYLALSLVIGELAGAIPHSGGAYAYVRTALGKVWGYIAGVSVLLEFVISPVAVSLTVGAYIQILYPSVPILLSAAVTYVVSIALHLTGAASSMKVEFVITAIAVLGLVVFVFIGAPSVSLDNLNAYGDGELFPQGINGLWAALPLAAWFYFAIESLPMTAEETRHPKDLAKALILAWITLTIVGLGTLTVAAGIGDESFPEAAAPLAVALQTVVGNAGWIVPVITIFSLIALLASFHAILLGYSRQVFALSRAGYLPLWLSNLNSRRVPHWALIVPAIFGYVFVIIGDTVLPDAIPALVTLSVMVAAVSYILMMYAAIVLRRTRPDLHRPYRVPGGTALMWVGLVLSAILIPAALMGFPIAFVIGVVAIAVFLVYYYAVASKRVGDMTAEEELAIIDSAEAELD